MAVVSSLPLSLLDKTWSYSSRSISSRSFNNRAQIIFTCFNVRRCCCVGDERRDSCWPDGFEVVAVVESVVFEGEALASSSEKSAEVAFSWWRRWSRRTSSLIRVNRASRMPKMMNVGECPPSLLTRACNRLQIRKDGWGAHRKIAHFVCWRNNSDGLKSTNTFRWCSCSWFIGAAIAWLSIVIIGTFQCDAGGHTGNLSLFFTSTRKNESEVEKQRETDTLNRIENDREEISTNDQC